MEQHLTPTPTQSIYCGECRRPTNHLVLHQVEEGSDRDAEYHWSAIHFFAQCAGCDAYCYAIVTESEDDWDPNTGQSDPNWRVFPTPVDGRRVMENDHQLPYSVATIYREVVEAINAKLSLLAAMGLRALIEAICIERNVAAPNLQQRIDGLALNGVLSTNQAQVLHGLRFLGNHAAHEIRKAQPGELLAALGKL